MRHGVSGTVSRFVRVLGPGRGPGLMLAVLARELPLHTSTEYREPLRLTARFVRLGDPEGLRQTLHESSSPVVEFWCEIHGHPSLIHTDFAVRILDREDEWPRYYVTATPGHQPERVIVGRELARLRAWVHALMDRQPPLVTLAERPSLASVRSQPPVSAAAVAPSVVAPAPTL